MADSHPKPPETIQEVGIHLSYLREDFTELKNIIKEQNRQYATKAEIAEVKNDQKELVKRSEVESLLKFWSMCTSTLGKVISTAVVLLVLSAAVQGTDIPKYFSDKGGM